ncbi:predicted protein [Postia placenta Mad-698-R]|nr:predicted protein [Postia placenta Mad-698-R]
MCSKAIRDTLRYRNPAAIQLDTSRLEYYSRFVKELSTAQEDFDPTTLEYLAPHLPSDFLLLPQTRVLKIPRCPDHMQGYDMLLGPALVEIDIEIYFEDFEVFDQWKPLRYGMSLLTRMCTMCPNLEVLRMTLENGRSIHIGSFIQVVQSRYTCLRVLHLSAYNCFIDDRRDAEFTSKPITDLLRTTCSRVQEFSSVEIPVPADSVIKLATNPNLRDVRICLDATALELSLFKGIHRPFSALRSMRFSVEHLDERSLSFLDSVSSGVLTRLVIDLEGFQLTSTMLRAHTKKLQQSPFRNTLTLFGLTFYESLAEHVTYKALKPLFDMPRLSRLFLQYPSDKVAQTIAQKKPHIEVVEKEDW